MVMKGERGVLSWQKAIKGHEEGDLGKGVFHVQGVGLSVLFLKCGCILVYEPQSLLENCQTAFTLFQHLYFSFLFFLPLHFGGRVVSLQSRRALLFR